MRIMCWTLFPTVLPMASSLEAHVNIALEAEVTYRFPVDGAMLSIPFEFGDQKSRTRPERVES